MWNDLSPVASECLHSRINLRFRLEWAKNPPRNNERNQSCKYPRWCAEQKGNSPVIPKGSSERGEERVERKGGDDAGNTSCNK